MHRILQYIGSLRFFKAIMAGKFETSRSSRCTRVKLSEDSDADHDNEENMANNCDFNGAQFAKYYLQEEDVQELDLQVPTHAMILRQIQEALTGKVPLLRRPFVQLADSSDTKSSETPGKPCFRVMQWNILAQSLCSGSDNFIRCPEAALQWEFRRLRLLEEILEVNPDILCLQEVDHFGFFLSVLEKVGYKGTFFPKPDSPCMYALQSNGPDGCAIFYRTKKFISLDKESIVLLMESTRQETNQVSVIYKLALRNDPGCEIIIATTHLKAKRGWQNLRDDQGAYLLNYMKKKCGNIPVIICGDFNAEYTEAVYGRFSKSSLNISSAYTQLDKDNGTEPPYTTWKIRGSRSGEEIDACHTIDYMWFSKKDLGVTALLQFPTAEEMGPDRVPSLSYPSDHFSLVADFAFL